MVRIGLVGNGFMATVRAIRYAAIDGVDVVAVASPSTSSDFVAEYTEGATVYVDAAEMYDAEPLDAVDVCTPTHTHRSLVIPAVDRELDVLCGKPIARTLSDAEALAAAVADADATVMTGDTLRFFPEYVTARDRVLAGDVGDPGTARTFRQSPQTERHGGIADDAKNRGVLLDLAIQDFDFLRWTLGEVVRVFARCRQWDGNEYALATLRFGDGAVAHVDARRPCRSSLPFTTRFEIAGDEGLLEFDSEECTPIEVNSTRDDDEPARNPTDEALEKDPYRLELEAFVDAVRNGTTLPVTIEDGIASLRVALAA